MGSSVSLPENTRVVIVGGGTGGTLLAKELDKDKRCQVTLVDSKAFFSYTPISVPLLASKDKDALSKEFIKMHTPFTDIVKNGRVVTGLLKRVDNEGRKIHVAATDGDVEIPYDILVLATGTTYNAPFKAPSDRLMRTPKDRTDELGDALDRLHAAKDVLVIGCGAVGTEIAAEVAVAYPDKTVHVVHPRERLLEMLAEKVGAKALAFFQKQKNVRLYLNEKADEKKGSGEEDDKADGEAKQQGRKTYVLRESKKEIQADVTYQTFGARPCTGYMRESGLEKCLDERGQLIVDEYLAVKGLDGVFALGDCINLECDKMAKNAKWHAEYLAKALPASAAHVFAARASAIAEKKSETEEAAEAPAKDDKLPKRTPLKLSDELKGMLISLGPDNAVMHLGFFKLIGFGSGGSKPAGKLKQFVTKLSYTSVR